MQKIKLLSLLCVAVVLLALINSNSESSHREKIRLQFFTDLLQFKADVRELAKLSGDSKDQRKLVKAFHVARESFKKTEAILAYYDDTYYAKLNGPNLVKPDKSSTQFQEVTPHGLQVLEELLADELTAEALDELRAECREMDLVLTNILNNRARFTFYDREIMESMQQEVIRLNAMGITGFDSPVMRRSLPESQTALKAMSAQLELMQSSTKTRGQHEKLEHTIQLAETAARQLVGADFDRFDRLAYVKEYLNPLFRGLVELHGVLGIETYSQTYGVPGALNENVKDLYAANLINRFFFLLTEAPSTIRA
ncbi:MAG: hypothetical protein V4616_09410 [Bacteroidota bacterium]